MRTRLAILIVVLAACSGETPVDPPGAPTIARVSGESQSGIVGEPLEQPLVVRVQDASGRDAGGVEVRFAAVTGGGAMAPSRVTTGADGLAQATFTLGPLAGQQAAVAAITLDDSAFTGPAVTFTATAASGPPATVVAARGDDVWGCAGRELLTAFVVRIEDRFGNPVPNVPVEWTIIEGGGALSEAENTTNDAGEATARLALGDEPGVNAVEAAVAGVDPVRFTATAGDCQGLGSIAFESPLGIETIGADGSGRTVLVPGAVSDPDWSRDGEWLAFTRTPDGGQTCAIHIARADGSEERPVSAFVDGQCDFDPAWSPDGSMIASARRGETLGYQIAVVNIDGSNLRVLVAESPDGFRVGHAGPSWSPDGTRIAFSFIARVKFGGGPRIAVVKADGSESFNVINTWARTPAWSPDGAKLAFSGFLTSEATVWLMNPDGSGAVSLGLPEPPASPIVHSIGWSPDGAQIVFAGQTLEGDPPTLSPTDLYIVHRDGTGFRQLTATTDLSESDASWRFKPAATGTLAARP